MQNTVTRLAQVFWGLALVAVDVRIRAFDILPDFVGYVLIALGATGLVSLSRHFNLARSLSWGLVGLSVAGSLFHGYFGMALRLIQLPVDGVMMWFLLGGVMELALSRQRPELVSRATLCRLAYVGLLCVSALLIVLARVWPGLAGALGTIHSVATIAVCAVIIYVVYEVKRAMAAPDLVPAPAN